MHYCHKLCKATTASPLVSVPWIYATARRPEEQGRSQSQPAGAALGPFPKIAVKQNGGARTVQEDR
ncbi:protein of unknown function [Paraburkholderia kururiensis]